MFPTVFFFVSTKSVLIEILFQYLFQRFFCVRSLQLSLLLNDISLQEKVYVLCFFNRFISFCEDFSNPADFTNPVTF